MNNFPEFSIVTVCFNSEKTITKTIESVLVQKFNNYEYIIVDGVSNDGTMDIVKSYEAKFNGRLRYISEPDKGIYDAFNKGVRMSKGKYVWIVNSDDYIEPDALENLYKITSLYSSDNAPIITGGLRLVKNGNQEILIGTPEKAKIAYMKDYMGAAHPSTLIPKYIYNQIGLYDDRYNIAGDLAWFHNAYGRGIEYLFVETVITNMLCEGISSRPNFKKDLEDRILFFRSKYKNRLHRAIKGLRWCLHYVRLNLKYYKSRQG